MITLLALVGSIGAQSAKTEMVQIDSPVPEFKLALHHEFLPNTGGLQPSIILFGRRISGSNYRQCELQGIAQRQPRERHHRNRKAGDRFQERRGLRFERDLPKPARAGGIAVAGAQKTISLGIPRKPFRSLLPPSRQFSIFADGH